MPSHEAVLPKLVTQLLVDSGLCKSKSEARRLIKGGGAKIDFGDGKTAVKDINTSLNEPAIIWAGKKKCVQIISD